jgi:hypothetical protein
VLLPSISDGSGPTVHASFRIIGHACRVGTAAGTGVGTGGIDVATGHVAHGVVAGIGVGETPQGGWGHAHDWCRCRTRGPCHHCEAIQAIITVGLLVGR